VSAHFLYLTNTRLVSMTTQGKRIETRREFAVSGAGVSDFDQHVSGMAPLPTHVFTDLADEDFRLDTVPHVSGRDRAAVIARKLAQIFRTTPYRYAQMQGREAEGRRDDRVMYTALTNPDLLRPWIEVLDRHKVPLEGVYSTAVFSERLLEELDLDFAHTLLVTFTPGEAMRQTYFKKNEIKFSRLTPLDMEPGQGLGAFVSEETLRTWQYLDSLRHFSPDDRLEVCMLVHATDRALVQPELRDFAQLQYNLIDMDQASMKLALKPPPLDSTIEEVIVHLYLLRRAPNHFASEEMRRHATLRRVRIGIKQASAAILAGGIAWGGWHVYQAFQGSEASQRVGQQVASLDAESESIVRSTPSLGVGGSTMRDTVAFYNSWIRSFPKLPEFVEPVSKVLTAHPDVRITQLSWIASDDPKTVPPALTPYASRLAPPVKSLARAPDPSAPTPIPDPGAAASFQSGKYEIALVEAMLQVPTEDFRRAIDVAQKLADDLGRVPGMRAEVVESPLDVSSTLQLQGKITPEQSQRMDARFVLRIVRERQGAV
jgi:hypothetical protein